MLLKDIVRKKVAIHPRNEQEARNVLNIIADAGHTWRGGEDPKTHKTYIDTFNVPIAYNITKDGITIAKRTYYSKKRYKIISALDFINNNK